MMRSMRRGGSADADAVDDVCDGAHRLAGHFASVAAPPAAHQLRGRPTPASLHAALARFEPAPLQLEHYVVSGASDGRLLVWNLRDDTTAESVRWGANAGQPAQEIHGHKAAVTCLRCLALDGRVYLLSADKVSTNDATRRAPMSLDEPR